MYTQEVSRCHRAAIIIAIDQSYSMGGRTEMNGCDMSKAEAVSIVVGQFIDELIMRSNCDGSYRNYYDIALVGYSGDSVYSLLSDKIAFLSITSLAQRKIDKRGYTLKFNTLHRGMLPFCEEVPMWIKPIAQGAKPMCKMLNQVTDLVENWCAKEENRNSFPPLVFNITDDEVSNTDYDMLRGVANRLRSSGTDDGNTLFFNIHISADKHSHIIFPNIDEIPLEIQYAHLLTDISSIMPEQFHSYVCECRSRFLPPPYIAMCYNASMSELVSMLHICSRSLTMIL